MAVAYHITTTATSNEGTGVYITGVQTLDANKTYLSRIWVATDKEGCYATASNSNAPVLSGSAKKLHYSASGLIFTCVEAIYSNTTNKTEGNLFFSAWNPAGGTTNFWFYNAGLYDITSLRGETGLSTNLLGTKADPPTNWAEYDNVSKVTVVNSAETVTVLNTIYYPTTGGNLTAADYNKMIYDIDAQRSNKNLSASGISAVSAGGSFTAAQINSQRTNTEGLLTSVSWGETITQFLQAKYNHIREIASVVQKSKDFIGGCVGCGSVCGTYCGANCAADCNTTCKTSCSGACIGCSTTCKTTCSTSCANATCAGGGCINTCSYACVGSCYGNCSTVCSTSCSGSCSTCWTTCSGTCANNGCTSGAFEYPSFSCSLACGSDCGTVCYGACQSPQSCSNACTVSCSGSCNNACYNTCDKSCVNGCTGCKSSCSGGTTCGNSCTGGCQDTCTGGCNTSCTGGCGSSCSNSCYNNCSTGCVSTCKTGCMLSCVSTCSNYCTSTAVLSI